MADHVEVRIRDRAGEKADGCGWEFDWRHHGDLSDIIAYRVVRQAEPARDPDDRVLALCEEIARLHEQVRTLRVAQQDEPAHKPVAWLKTWDSVGGAQKGMRRVDLTPECEVWLSNMFPTITPLYTAPPAGPPWCCEQGERLHVQVCPECAETSAAFSAAMSPLAAERDAALDALRELVDPLRTLIEAYYLVPTDASRAILDEAIRRARAVLAVHKEQGNGK